MSREPLAKLRLHAEFFILRGNKSRLPRPRRAWCFRNESPAESGRGHASTRDAIKHLGSRSMVSFPDATGRDRAALRLRLPSDSVPIHHLHTGTMGGPGALASSTHRTCVVHE